MKTYASTQPESYQVLGNTLRIHWDAKEITRESMDGPQTQWEANEAVCDINDGRNALIEKIIGSVYSTGAELAAINNKDSKPDDYAEYQALRIKAKELADGWLNKE
jgi:predicted Mrr-cat superfamily restriction endonuclease